jgi:hypothetical protein
MFPFDVYLMTFMLKKPRPSWIIECLWVVTCVVRGFIEGKEKIHQVSNSHRVDSDTRKDNDTIIFFLLFAFSSCTECIEIDE